MDLSSLLEVQVNEMKMEINTKKKDEHDIKTRTRNFRISDCNSIASNSNLSTHRIDNISITSTDRIASTISASSTISQEESTFYNIVFKDIATVRFCKIHCTACNIHIGSAPAAIHNMCEHPVLHTLLCARCREFYGDGSFEQGDDATDMFCRWCANGGNLYCCSYCSNTFCSKCIKRNFSSIIRKKIEADEKWKCFVCNPRDLYGARALHWALLQHVQTVTRILKNDKKISAKELEDKMNLDESQCCMRRNKRKYRRTESDSEEEDKTYVPDTNELNMKRKVKKFKMNRYSNPNGNVKQIQSHTKLLIPIKPAPTLSTVTIQTLKSELSQSKIEHNKQIVNSSENLILPSPSVINTDSSSLQGYSDSGVQSSSFYYPFMNNAGSSTFVQISSAVKPVTQITLSSLPSQPTSQSSTSQLPLPNAMVSIPNPVRKRGRPRLLPKTSNVTVTNVIELDSDSDEPKVVEQQNDSMINTDITNICSNKVVPVALTWENSDNNNVEQPLKEMCASVKKDPSFSEIMSPHIQELDKILCDVKERVCLLFNSFNTIQDVELTAQQKVKHFYRYMHNTVFQLSHINDRVVREYNHWTNSRKTNTDASFAVDKNASVIQNIEIPLDMICINDSETDSDCEKSEYQIKEPSDLVKSNNIIKDLLFFKKDVVHRSVGDDTILLHSDKAIQVCDDVSCHYEKHIDYSVINRFGSKTNNSDHILKPMVKRQENFGKYEEQFINYLQHIENHGIEIEDAEELMDLDELPSQEPKEITLSQNIDLCISTDKEKNSEQERNTESCINSLFKDDKIDGSPNAIHKDNITNKSNIDIKIVEKKLQKTNNHPVKEKAISIMSNNDTSSSQNSKTAASIKMTALGNDCTIIDD